MDIKNTVKAIAHEKGIKMEDIAKKLEITKGGLSKALNGNPTIGTLTKVANVLEVPVSDLLEEEKKQPDNSIFIKCDKCGNIIKVKEIKVEQ